MDKRDFTVIENKNKTDVKVADKTLQHQTNPITKNFVKFINNEKFSVRDLFTK